MGTANRDRHPGENIGFQQLTQRNRWTVCLLAPSAKQEDWARVLMLLLELKTIQKRTKQTSTNQVFKVSTDCICIFYCFVVASLHPSLNKHVRCFQNCVYLLTFHTHILQCAQICKHGVRSGRYRERGTDLSFKQTWELSKKGWDTLVIWNILYSWDLLCQTKHTSSEKPLLMFENNFLYLNTEAGIQPVCGICLVKSKCSLQSKLPLSSSKH